ncbi:OsmC family protein [Rhizobacter sp. AJA081-3]|uniref:OsmC family protein n=1 Tax=Rhizobacter sp. AJA081-3 TaxID=2753607 RepID=UPI001ADF7225|nr:OsmC family protein [Rhizobacter sp. AJA081-3]QTN23021.1 OsmC family protein [Rhizobacter sp. AJA081-3]
MSSESVTVRLAQRQDYQFDVQFGPGVPLLLADEPAPLGQGLGPSPVQLLAAAVGNCLSDSLLFALRKFKQKPEPLQCEVSAEVGRNAEGRVRVLGLQATLTLGVPGEALEHLERVLGTFESYCTVTQSIAQGIPVRVQVIDAQGAVLK